jgi:F-type H+-transporting ATPase subunit b
MEKLRADYIVRIAEVEAEARGHIQTAIKEAQSERERILAEARAQSEQTLQQGVADMEREKTEALVSLRESMVGMALTALQKTLGAAADPAVLRTSIESSIPASPARN